MMHRGIGEGELLCHPIPPTPDRGHPTETKQQQDAGGDGPAEPRAAGRMAVYGWRFGAANDFARWGRLEANCWKFRFGGRSEQLLLPLCAGQCGLTGGTQVEVVSQCVLLVGFQEIVKVIQ